MSNFENIKAFETALKESKELLENFETAAKRIMENKEASCDGELMVKAAAEVGYTLSMAELERAFAQSQELSDEDLDKVAGGGIFADPDAWCMKDYACIVAFKHDSDNKQHICFADYNCFQFFMH